MDFHAQGRNSLLNLRGVEPNPSLEPTYDPDVVIVSSYFS